MSNIEYFSKYLSKKRKEKNLTQQQLAARLNVSFQAVSKWENAVAYPNVELLTDLSSILGTTVDELLNGRERVEEGMTYSKAGVDVVYTDSIKAEMSPYLRTDDKRVLNGVGAFASLYELDVKDMKNPVLVLKAEEPGSKQKLAMQYGYMESVCHDMVNHLVNDGIVMGAKPLAVLDTIICGNAEKDTVKAIIKGVSEACRNNGCSLVGGETSIQPGVLDKGVYILTSSLVGVVEKEKIIDGSRICEGDVILSVASNGLHTNGYSLVRMMMDEMPNLKNEWIGKETFIEAIMKPHASYYPSLKDIIYNEGIHGIAHVTGGGIQANVTRIIPEGLCAMVDLGKFRPLPLFSFIKSNGAITDDEMLHTFNCGVGLVLVVRKNVKDYVINHISKYYDCTEIGRVVCGSPKVDFENRINWD